MGLIHMLVVCGITDLQNLAGNCLAQMFIDSQGFTGIDYFYMLRIRDLPRIMKDPYLDPNQEARLGAIQQKKLQVLVWRTKYCHHCGFENIMAAWTAAELKSFITQINIESTLGGYIKVAHPVKMETGRKLTTWDIKWVNCIGSMVGVSGVHLDCVMRRNIPVGWNAVNNLYCLKYQEIHIGLAW